MRAQAGRLLPANVWQRLSACSVFDAERRERIAATVQVPQWQCVVKAEGGVAAGAVAFVCPVCPYRALVVGLRREAVANEA